MRVSIERIKGCKRERGLNCYGYIMKISEDGRGGRRRSRQRGTEEEEEVTRHN